MKQFLLFMFMCSTTWLYAQSGSVSGQVTDKDNGEALIGATVVVQGTSKGAVTNIEGKFSLGDLENGDITLLVNYVGFGEQKMTYTVTGGNIDAGTISLSASAIGLNEVMVMASIAIDRKTPVAISNIKAAEIQAKIGNQEFPEILKSTPGVYATKAGGGFGDGRINIRGFDSENVAVLINGVPVNDMENGRVYWSNWAGLTDATNTMQVQRGLGASKVAVPSVGGTINIISKASDREAGGHAYVGTGNNNYTKFGFELSSGLNEKGWAFTASAAKTTGAMYADGTEFEGYSYFTNISKQINKSHEVALTIVGAQQRHGQRQTMMTLGDINKSDRDRRYNQDWGYKNGQVLHAEDNFYHKPQASLNWYWTINDKMYLSTAVYASYGTGGGGGTAGDFNKDDWRKDGVIDFDAIVDENAASATGESSAYLRASRNDHKWFGGLSSLNYEVSSSLDLMAGLDVRSYKGIHFQEVTDLLGGDYATDDSDVNNPNRLIGVGDKRSYHNDGLVEWYGAFMQAEYSKDALSAFVTLNVSQTSYTRIDYFNYLEGEQESDQVNFLGFGAKGGANYNLNDNHNVFLNGGYFEKAPYFNATFLNFQNDINEDAVNQKILSAELGYGFRSNNLTVNVNVYNTIWKDRTLLQSFSVEGTDTRLTANLTGVNAVHRGVEIDAKYTPIKGLEITGMVSVGDWKWQNNLLDVALFDENQVEQERKVNLYISDLKVGDAAQTTAALGITYEILTDLKLGLSGNYYDDLYAQYDPNDRDGEENAGVQAWEVPAYGLVDLNLSYDFDIAGLKTSVFANVYNLLDEAYISDAQDGGSADQSLVYYGAGRTWSLAMKIRF